MAHFINVLLVEDNQGDADLIIELMDRAGEAVYAISCVPRLSQALGFVAANRTDIVLLDLNLPDSSGIDTVRTLCREVPWVPVVVLTGHVDKDLGMEAVKAGAQEYLTKGGLSRELLLKVTGYAIERHQTQERLRKSEQFLRSSLDSLSASIAILDSDGTILAVNRAWHQFADVNNADKTRVSPGVNYLDVCLQAGEKDQPSGEVIARGIIAVLNGTKTCFELNYPCHSPSRERWFHMRVTPFYNKDLKHAVIAHENITSRTLAENALRKNEELFRKVFEILPVGLWIADNQGELKTGNPEGIRIWGGSPETDQSCLRFSNARYLPAGDRVTPEDWALTRTLRDGVTVDGELLEIQAADGVRRNILNYTAPVLDSSGNLEAAVVVNQDVTELMAAREEIRNSELRLKAILDAQTSMVMLMDMAFNVIWANKTACDEAGMARADILGKKCYHVWNRGSQDRCPNCPVNSAISTNTIVSKKRIKPDGKTWISVGCPVRDEAGTMVSAVEVTNDISDVIAMEEKLRQAQKMESLGTLAGGIAHDFNNILSVILGFTTLALGDTKGMEILHDDLQEIYQAAQRATDLVRQILTFSRRSEAELRPLEISPIVKEALKLLRSILPASIDIQVDAGKRVSPVLADPTQIHQIIMNLCTNASHAMEPDGGILKVTLSQILMDGSSQEDRKELAPGEYVELTVSDTGSGIPPEILGSIFDPYFTTKNLGEGTGLGLAVVHGIVKECGGEILVRSDPGKGTCFSLYFPVAGVSPIDIDEMDSDDFSGRPACILVVDDEPSITKMVGRILEQQGNDIVVRNDSVEALALFRENPDRFDLVITDMTMPKMTGDKLARQLIQIRPDIPVILMTGYSKQVSEDSIPEQGFNALIMKPISRQVLLRTVRDTLAPDAPGT